MPDNNGIFRRDRQFLFLGNQRVIGAQSVQITNNFAANPLIFVGMGQKYWPLIPRGQQSANVNFNSLLINSDPFYQYAVGPSLVNAFILQSPSNLDDNYCMLSGYVNTYSCKYQIGQIPEVSTTFAFINEVGKIPTGNLSNSDYTQLNSIKNNFNPNFTPIIPYGNSVNLILDSFINNNRVQNFTLNINSKNLPIFFMGARFPSRVDNIPPITIELQCQFQLGKYDFPVLSHFPQFQRVKDLTINIKSFDSGAFIQSYSFPNLTLTNLNYNTSADGITTVDLGYGGTLNQ